MRKLIIALLAIALGNTACKKGANVPPVTGSNGQAGVTVKDSKATVVGAGQHKKSDDALALNYDLAIESVALNSYRVIIKARKNTLQGAKFNESASPISGMAIAISNTQKGEIVPLSVLLESNGESNGVFTFPTFEYKGDLDHEMVDVAVTMKVKGGDMIIKDNAQFTLFGASFVSVPGSGNLSDGKFTIPAGDVVTVGGVLTATGFTITLSPKDNMISLIDKATVFVLPSGKTEAQSPELAKIKFGPLTKDNTVDVDVVLAGDPAGNIQTVYFQPAPIPDPKKPGATITLPEIKLNLTHFNRNRGISKWSSNYKLEKQEVNDAVKNGAFDGKPVFTFGDGWARIAMVARL